MARKVWFHRGAIRRFAGERLPRQNTAHEGYTHFWDCSLRCFASASFAAKLVVLGFLISFAASDNVRNLGGFLLFVEICSGICYNSPYVVFGLLFQMPCRFWFGDHLWGIFITHLSDVDIYGNI